MKNISRWIKTCFIGLIIPLVPLSGAWNPPVQLSTPGDVVSTIDGPVLSVNTANNAVAVWAVRPTPPPGGSVLNANIVASSYFFGTGWQPDVIISDTSLNIFGGRNYTSQGDPSVAMNNLGYAVATWEGRIFVDPPQDYFEAIFSSTRSPDGTWSPVQVISALDLSDIFQDPENPIVAVNDAGLAVATWTEITGTGVFIKANFLPQGGVWGTPVILDNPPTFFTEDAPYVAINERGDAVAAWKVASDTPGRQKVGAATYNAGTGLWTTVDLDPSQDDIARVPRVGIDENGNAVVTWNRELSPGGPFETVAASFTYGVGWGAPVVIDTGNSPQVFVVMDHAGNSTATWTKSVGGDSQVYASRLPLGGVWSTPQIISTDGLDNGINAGVDQGPISVDSDGNVIVIITQSDDTLQSVAFFTALGWQAPENIFTPGNTFLTNIGYGSCGFAIANWGDVVSFPTYIIFASDNFGILPPPSGFRFSKCCDKSATHKKCFNNLEWTPSSGCFAFFQIRRNGVLVATIPGNKKPLFRDPICKKNQSVTYALTATSIYGVESAPVFLTVP